ncbi:hypothetical protein [Sulfitobacter aestuariivivens]|uniref:hypothetical protein n=1 Tax=Sulfitobacter aestuariivivens TaxID=2766981 RepID=UPI00361E5897
MIRAGTLCLLAVMAMALVRNPQHPLIERALTYGVLPAFLMKLNDEQARLAELRIVSTSPLIVIKVSKDPTQPARTVPPNRTNVAGGEMDR